MVNFKCKDFYIFCILDFKASYDNDMIVSCHDYNINEQCSPFDANKNKCKSIKSGMFYRFMMKILKIFKIKILKIDKNALV